MPTFRYTTIGQNGSGPALLDAPDRALALPPLNMRLAHDLMAQTRIQRLLCGYRDRPAADLDAIALVLLKVARLAEEVDVVRSARLARGEDLATGEDVPARVARRQHDPRVAACGSGRRRPRARTFFGAGR
mgnify:CR=1 FL=1